MTEAEGAAKLEELESKIEGLKWISDSREETRQLNNHFLIGILIGALWMFLISRMLARGGE